MMVSTTTMIRRLADALSRQRQADEHGIYCAVPRQAVDAAIRHLRAQADAQPVAWMHIDGRVISAATMDQAYMDGGAMQAILHTSMRVAGSDGSVSFDLVAAAAYRMADAMLKAREGA